MLNSILIGNSLIIVISKGDGGNSELTIEVYSKLWSDQLIGKVSLIVIKV